MAMMRGVFVVALWCFASVVVGAVVEAEVKPNNYPNFEFHEEEGTPATFGEFQENQFTTEEGAHDRFAKGHEFRAPFDASDRFDEHASFSAQDGVVYDARRDEDEGEAATYKVGDAETRFDLREQAEKEASSHEVRFTNVHHVDEEVDKAAAAVREGSSRFYTPSSDPDFAFRFAKPESDDQVGDQKRVTYSQFNFDNSDATNDPTATYGTTTPVLAADNEERSAPATASGHGCANMYWAEHTKQWPSFFSVNTQVTQAFGTRAGQIYGTTTLLQALYDTRDDGYSQLLSHGTAALLNAYAMPNYGLRHDTVMDQFVGALASRTAAGVQAQKFSNANHAYGPNECLN